jgi:signal transduction histidine kinase
VSVKGETLTSVETLDEMARAVAAVSDDLLASYERLERRAKHMELELERRVGELEAILASLPTGVAVRDASGALVRSNTAYEELQDEGRGSVQGTTPSPDGACTFSSADGSLRHVYRKSSAIVSPSGERLGSVEILDDRTEVHALSERVHHMNKMAALGTMATGIAHEIRNPLNAVQGYSELILMRATGDETLDTWAANIVAGVKEVDGIISSLLTISRPEPLHLESCDAADLCREAAARSIEGDATPWSITIQAPAASLSCDRIKLRQALRNLIANAANVQPDGGNIRIRVTSDSEGTTFSVEDSGSGFNHSTAARCREPFFTTRADGCGLGLPLVETIVQLHGGQLEIDPNGSDLGGALVSFWIPTNPQS